MDRRKSLKALALGTVSTGLLLDACKLADKKEAGADAVVAKDNNAENPTGINRMKEELRAKPQIARYVTGFGVSFADQVDKVYHEMTGMHLPSAQKTAFDSRRQHAHDHGLDMIA